MYLLAACTKMETHLTHHLPARPTAITQPARDGRTLYLRPALCKPYVRIGRPSHGPRRVVQYSILLHHYAPLFLPF